MKPMYGFAAGCLVAAVSLSAAAGCGNTRSAEPVPTTSPGTGPVIQSYTERSSIRDGSGQTLLPLKPAVRSLGYRMEESQSGEVLIGYTDVMFRLKPGDTSAQSMGEPLTLPQPPERLEGIVYMTPESMSRLFRTVVGWDPKSGEIAIDTPTEGEGSSSPLPSGSPSGNAGGTSAGSDSGTIRIQSLSSSEANELVAYAKQFLGVPYDFGAEPYDVSHRFDCSSFTQHVFKKFGVSLPRLARDQDNRGTRVQRSDLKPGDLIFFTVPGRFESDAVPGHVGIYIGGGQFIHTWGDPGVQISKLDSGYWSNVVLHMQRVI
ncbi:C40 family peptidase [Paenibacillus glufosinatiresistens]|uniref:C40 family peptidase n=1 Tax=Paenibacillus glufosinatiresistens TaxID=3070657 RepID=UPI00286E7030|nr:NlpC/P60 family protein [Paenibacillus sp. YX.27]